MSKVIPKLVIPISLVTTFKVFHFVKTQRKLVASLPYIILLLNTNYVWVCYEIYQQYYEGYDNKWAYNATYAEWASFSLLEYSYFLDVTSIFLYTWTFIDVISGDKVNIYIKFLRTYKLISLIFCPLVSYSLYIALVFANARWNYDSHNEVVGASVTTVNQIQQSLDFWNGFLVLLSCTHLAILLCQVNKISKRINQEQLHTETQKKV